MNIMSIQSVKEPAPERASAACVKVTFKIFPTLLCISILALSTGNFVQLVKYCKEKKRFLKRVLFVVC